MSLPRRIRDKIRGLEMVSMRQSSCGLALAAAVLAVVSPTAQPSQPITVRVARVIDGRGQVTSNQTITVRGTKIVGVEASKGDATHDLGGLTLLPGFIDTHVHIGWHFGPDGRWPAKPPPPAETALDGAENAYVTLMAGFTTVQSVGADSDKLLRDAIKRGLLPGPRILTSLGSIADAKLTPTQIREEVRKRKADGADLIKIFASASIRDGGTPTLSQEQLDAACGAARAEGLRSMVHAQSAEAMVRAARANCTVIEHGALATPEAFELMAERGVWFDPNIGLVLQNYLENKSRFLGVGNYTEDGFAAMEKALALSSAMFRAALETPRLKMVMGTDAVAGAHGRNINEALARMKAGQRPMDVIVSMTSAAAQSMALDREIGAIAPGLEADLVAIDGDPLTDPSALTRVRFVMRAGTVYKR
jgi:imidazolonepropionase-like amidohydrolase